MQKNVWLFGTAAIALVVVGLILSYGSHISDTVKDDMPSTTTRTNYTTLITTSTATSMPNTDLASVNAVYNDSNYTGALPALLLLNSGNYSYNLLSGWVLIDGNFTTGSNVTFDYSYYSQTAGRDAARNTTRGLGNLSKNQPLVAIVVVGAIIVGLVMAGFGGFLKGRRL